MSAISEIPQSHPGAPRWRIHWDRIDPEVTHVAVDEDGFVCAYQCQPVIGRIDWLCLACHRYEKIGEIECRSDWRELCFQRPKEI
jgi:hypothetical protein